MLSKELVGATTRPILLSILASGESYGYAIIRRLHEISGRTAEQSSEQSSEQTVEWKDGTVYPLLHRLEEDGLIESVWRTADSGRKRKYYAITPAGRAALADEKAQWLRMDAILAQLWGLEPRMAT